MKFSEGDIVRCTNISNVVGYLTYYKTYMVKKTGHVKGVDCIMVTDDKENKHVFDSFRFNMFVKG